MVTVCRPADSYLNFSARFFAVVASQRGIVGRRRWCVMVPYMVHPKEIFFAAIECTSSDELAALLNETCSDNVALRARVEELFRAHKAAGGFLARDDFMECDNLADATGSTIGPYHLIAPIG